MVKQNEKYMENLNTIKQAIREFILEIMINGKEKYTVIDYYNLSKMLYGIEKLPLIIKNNSKICLTEEVEIAETTIIIQLNRKKLKIMRSSNMNSMIFQGVSNFVYLELDLKGLKNIDPEEKIFKFVSLSKWKKSVKFILEKCKSYSFE